MWTPDRIRHLLNTNDLAVERAIVVLYDRQTQDEKRDSDTKHDNKRGFKANHASTMSFFARIILKGWKQDRNKERVHLNPVKLAKARNVALQYTRQLCEQANEKARVRAEARVSRSRPSMDEINRQEDERERRKEAMAESDLHPQTREPLPGTYAYTARAMAEIMPDFDWDSWKDQMKDEMGSEMD